MSELKYESINENDSNNLRNLKGAAPLRYFSQDEILKKELPAERYSIVGNKATAGPKVQNSDVDRWQSTNLNELQTYKTFQVHQPFIGSQHVDLNSINDSNRLRSYGEPRFTKKQQLVTEKGFGRNNFIAPNIKPSSNDFIIQNNDFVNGYSSNVPNFKVLGLSLIHISEPTRPY